MASYAEEQLDWLHNQHEQLVEQTELLRRQTMAIEHQAATLNRIAKHTGFMYGVLIVYLVLTGIVLLAILFGGARL